MVRFCIGTHVWKYTVLPLDAKYHNTRSNLPHFWCQWLGYYTRHSPITWCPVPTTSLFTCHSVEFVIHHTFFHQISRVLSTCDSLKVYRMGSWKMHHCMCAKTCDFSTMMHHLIFTCGLSSSGPMIWATADRSWWPDCLDCTFSWLDPAKLPVGSNEILDLWDSCGIRGSPIGTGYSCSGCWMTKDWWSCVQLAKWIAGNCKQNETGQTP